MLLIAPVASATHYPVTPEQRSTAERVAQLKAEYAQARARLQL